MNPQISRRSIHLLAIAAISTLWLQGAPAADGRGPTPTVQVRPEYERALKSVYLSVPSRFRDPRQAAAPDRHIEFVRAAYSELIAALPAYTSIDLAVADSDQDGVADHLRSVAATRPFRTHVVEQLHADLDMWAQDLGERIIVDGEDRFLVPMPFDENGSYNGELAGSRRRVAHRVFPNRTVDADFVFEGGNLAFDRVGDGMRVFIGYNDVSLTIDNYRRRGRSLDSAGVAQMVSASFGGAEVVVVGRSQQSPLLFHLDQAFILLGNNVAVVNRLVGPPSREQRQLEDTRTQLERLGYRTIAIDHTQTDVRDYRVSTNAVPFVDAQTGVKTILFPVFPGEVKGAPQGRLTRDDLTGKSLAAYKAYLAAGYLPVPIRDFAHGVGGNTHCITNVLD